jgi:hypothetical protein
MVNASVYLELWLGLVIEYTPLKQKIQKIKTTHELAKKSAIKRRGG